MGRTERLLDMNPIKLKGKIKPKRAGVIKTFIIFVKNILKQ